MSELININEEQVCAINDFEVTAILVKNNVNLENIDISVLRSILNNIYGMSGENHAKFVKAEIKKGEIFYKPECFGSHNDFIWHTWTDSYVILINNDRLFIIPKDVFNGNFITKKNLSSIYGICNNPN